MTFSAEFLLITHDANGVAKAFLEGFICQYRISESIVIDCKTDFISNIFKSCCKLLKV